MRPCSARSAPARFKRDMSMIVFLSKPAEAIPRLMAVVMMPVPRGLVSTSRSPGRAAALVRRRFGWTNPVTDRPYSGSALRTVCPPTSAHPASRTLAAPPRKNLCDHLGRHEVVGNGQEVERGERAATHRVDIRECIRGGDLAKRKRVVDDRGKKIGRLHKRAPSIETINPGIVGGVTTDEEIGIASARAG